MNNSPNTIERFQKAGKALGVARQRNGDEGFAIIIEGPRDKIALKRLGFTGPLEVVNRGWGMDRFIAYLYETYGTRTDDRKATMTLPEKRTTASQAKAARERRRLRSRPQTLAESHRSTKRKKKSLKTCSKR